LGSSIDIHILVAKNKISKNEFDSAENILTKAESFDSSKKRIIEQLLDQIKIKRLELAEQFYDQGVTDFEELEKSNIRDWENESVDYQSYLNEINSIKESFTTSCQYIKNYKHCNKYLTKLLYYEGLIYYKNDKIDKSLGILKSCIENSMTYAPEMTEEVQNTYDAINYDVNEDQYENESWLSKRLFATSLCVIDASPFALVWDIAQIIADDFSRIIDNVADLMMWEAIDYSIDFIMERLPKYLQTIGKKILTTGSFAYCVGKAFVLGD
jgi:hypothetical protein